MPQTTQKQAASKTSALPHVVIRSAGSGVWLGQLVEHDRATRHVVVRDARRVWSWEGAASCSGLASHGPRAGRITPAVPGDSTIADVLEVLPVTADALTRFSEVKPWVA